jgi:hypothetical protein
MVAHKELLRDPLAYANYIGKHDRQHTLAAFAERGKDTIVRLCFTPGEFTVPLRFLGYIAAAQHITRTYLPEAQLQVVAAIQSSARINRTPLDRSAQAARRIFAQAASHPALQRSRPERMLFGFDMPGERLRPQAARIAPLTRHYPEARTLAASARTRQANYPAYVAAHLVLHDMVDSVVAERPVTEQPDMTAGRIVSIGALSERAFYAARMRCRTAPDFMAEDMVPATGQIFTRHVLPPYIYSRQHRAAQPEPHLSTPRAAYLDLREVAERERQVFRLDSPDRDLIYLQHFIEQYAPGREYRAVTTSELTSSTAGG